MMIRIATNADKSGLKDLWQATFHESQSFLDWLFDVRFPRSRCFVAEDDGKTVSALHGFPARFSVRGQSLPCWLIGGVATLPDYRGKGYMHRVFAHALAYMGQEGVAAALYHPVDFAIYASLGHFAISDAKYITLSSAAHWFQPSGSGPSLQNVNLLGDVEALCRCYQAFSEDYSGMILRGNDEFAFKCSDYASDSGQCKALLGPSGQVEAYCIYSNQAESLDCEEWVAPSPDASARLYAAMAELAGAAGKTLSLRLPPDTNLVPAYGDAIQQPHCAMGVSNVSQLLSALGLSGGAVEVTDAIVPENQGTYDLDGKRIAAPPQLSIPAGRLAQWAMGYCTIQDLAAMGRATVLDPAIVTVMDALPPCPCYCIDEY